MMQIKWVPLFGELQLEGDDVVFKGALIDVPVGHETKKQARVGRAVSNRVFNGGTISVDVTFSEPTGIEQWLEYPLIAELIVFTNPATGDMVTAGIGGEFFLYSVRMWDERNQKWLGSLIKGGFIRQLPLNMSHTISVTVESSQIRLSIDTVQLGSADLPFPIIGSQIGLFAQSTGDVRFSNLHIEEQKPKVFVVMPFTGPYNDLFEHVFSPVCRRCELEVHRSDKTYGPGLIIADIVQRIMQSQIIIAEITPNPPNANVYLEVGFAMAMRKALILIADRSCPNPLPFDISPFRVMFYENTIAGKRDMEMTLIKHLSAILPAYSPIMNAYHELTRA